MSLIRHTSVPGVVKRSILPSVPWSLEPNPDKPEQNKSHAKGAKGKNVSFCPVWLYDKSFANMI